MHFHKRRSPTRFTIYLCYAGFTRGEGPCFSTDRQWANRIYEICLQHTDDSVVHHNRKEGSMTDKLAGVFFYPDPGESFNSQIKEVLSPHNDKWETWHADAWQLSTGWNGNSISASLLITRLCWEAVMNLPPLLISLSCWREKGDGGPCGMGDDEWADYVMRGCRLYPNHKVAMTRITLKEEEHDD